MGAIGVPDLDRKSPTSLQQRQFIFDNSVAAYRATAPLYTQVVSEQVGQNLEPVRLPAKQIGNLSYIDLHHACIGQHVEEIGDCLLSQLRWWDGIRRAIDLRENLDGVCTKENYADVLAGTQILHTSPIDRLEYRGAHALLELFECTDLARLEVTAATLVFEDSQ